MRKTYAAPPVSSGRDTNNGETWPLRRQGLETSERPVEAWDARLLINPHRRMPHV